MKFRFVFLIFIAVLTLWLYPDWDRLRYPEYDRIVSYSETKQPIFEQRLLSQMNDKSTIYIRNLVDFDWDTVCVMEGYSRLRQDLAQKNFYNKDIPELEHYPQIQESTDAFVFLKQDKPVAVIHHFKPLMRYHFGICSEPDKARLKLIQPHAVPEYKKGSKENRYVVQPINLKKYQGCKGTLCDLTFYGE